MNVKYAFYCCHLVITDCSEFRISDWMEVGGAICVKGKDRIFFTEYLGVIIFNEI